MFWSSKNIGNFTKANNIKKIKTNKSSFFYDSCYEVCQFLFVLQVVDEELFNPDYVEVDRVLEESKSIDPKTQEEVTHYLVKWRSLAYEDSTWELQQDVDPEKVKIFKRFSTLPPADKRKVRHLSSYIVLV